MVVAVFVDYRRSAWGLQGLVVITGRACALWGLREHLSARKWRGHVETTAVATSRPTRQKETDYTGKQGIGEGILNRSKQRPGLPDRKKQITMETKKQKTKTFSFPLSLALRNPFSGTKFAVCTCNMCFLQRRESTHSGVN